MTDRPKSTRSTVIPGMRYHDAAAAVEWLCRAFGFEQHLVVPGEDDSVVHARLVLGGGMIMVGQARDDPYDELVKPPADVGGVCTQGIYIMVADADAHYARARAEGAGIVMEVENQPFGGRMYTCRDPEGHIWNFGDTDLWG